MTPAKLAEPELAAKGLVVAARLPKAPLVHPESVNAVSVMEFTALETRLPEASST